MRISLWQTSLSLIVVFLLTGISCRLQDGAQESKVELGTANHWQQSVDSILPLFGHRNWILVVDKAFPALAASSGMQVINTEADMTTVLGYLNNAIEQAPHVNAQVFMDKELTYISESTIAPFQDSINRIFGNQPVQFLLHDSVFTQVAAVSRNFQVLILKTNSFLAYSSVYLQLDCKYWNADKEKALRAVMKSGKKAFTRPDSLF